MRPEVGAIILAAGLSRRMGAKNKLLLPVGGVPMIRRMVATYRAVCDGEVLVVTGHQAEAISAALSGSGARTVVNSDYADGQQTSVACGLRSAPDSDLLLIGLGDQPRLRDGDLRALLAAHRGADTGRISIPAHEGTRGNPIVVTASLRARLLDDPKRPGCGQFTRAHAEHVQFLELDAPGFFADVDSPEAYAALDEQVAERATWDDRPRTRTTGFQQENEAQWNSQTKLSSTRPRTRSMRP